MKLHLGLSTCPNDTFTFAALLEGRSETYGLTFEAELCDVEELNQRLAAGEFDLAKGSFAAALDVCELRAVGRVGSTSTLESDNCSRLLCFKFGGFSLTCITGIFAKLFKDGCQEL